MGHKDGDVWRGIRRILEEGTWMVRTWLTDLICGRERKGRKSTPVRYVGEVVSI